MSYKYKADKNLYKVFSTLSNPVRLKLFTRIMEESCGCDPDINEITGNCVTRLSQDLKLPQPTVSNHVKELINVGLVTTEKKGKIMYLYGSEKIFKEFLEFTKFIGKNLE